MRTTCTAKWLAEAAIYCTPHGHRVARPGLGNAPCRGFPWGGAWLVASVVWAAAGCSGSVGAGPSLTATAEDHAQPQEQKEEIMEQAVFGAGCFWGVEAAFRQIEGVADAEVGYSGGHTENPTYKQVCTGKTGHAEVVRVFYDPAKVSYEDLLDVFWSCHDPTQLNRQGPDVGTQYRSAIFYLSDQQRLAAEASKRALAQSGRHTRPIVTQIAPAGPFYRAEEYHQQYLQKRGRASCRLP